MNITNYGGYCLRNSFSVIQLWSWREDMPTIGWKKSILSQVKQSSSKRLYMWFFKPDFHVVRVFCVIDFSRVHGFMWTCVLWISFCHEIYKFHLWLLCSAVTNISFLSRIQVHARGWDMAIFWCCYITVDSGTTALQNSACTYRCISKQMHYKTPFSHNDPMKSLEIYENYITLFCLEIQTFWQDYIN